MTIFQICTNVVFAPQPKNRGGAGATFPQHPPPEPNGSG